MGLIEAMNELMDSVIPPPEADHRAQRRYRLRVTLVACSAFCGLISFSSLSLGMVPWLFPGFARADEMQALQADASHHWSFELSASILDFREKQCHSTSQEAKALYAAEIQSRIAEYQKLARQPYQLPACTDL